MAELPPPFDPGRYVKAVQGAAEAKSDVLTINSLTHAWAGEGGILEFVDRATQAVKNNFAALREASTKHNALVEVTGLRGDDIIGKTVLDVLPEIESHWIEKYGQGLVLDA